MLEIRHYFILLLVLVLLNQSASLLATKQNTTQNGLITSDRPGYSISPSLLTTGLIQIESGYRYSHLNKLDEFTIGEMLIRIGLWQPLELRFGINSYTWVDDESNNDSNSGKDEISVGTKIKILDQIKMAYIHIPVTSLVLQTTLPTGNNEVSENKFQPQGKICIGYTLSNIFSVTLNTGYMYASEDGSQYHTIIPSIKLIISPDSTLDIFLEYCGNIPLSATHTLSNIIQTGISYQIHNSLKLDMYYELQFVDNDLQHSGGFGATAILPWTF